MRRLLAAAGVGALVALVPVAAGAAAAGEPSAGPSVLAPLPEEPGRGTVQERPLRAADTDRERGLPVVLAVVALGGAGSALVRVLLAEPAVRLR